MLCYFVGLLRNLIITYCFYGEKKCIRVPNKQLAHEILE